jgi:hypothetical protein
MLKLCFTDFGLSLLALTGFIVNLSKFFLSTATYPILIPKYGLIEKRVSSNVTIEFYKYFKGIRERKKE